MSNRYFTVMVVPDRDSRVRSWRVPKRRVVQAAYALGIVFVLSLAATLHYASVFERIGENRLLAEENAQLREQLRVVEEKVSHIGETLDRPQYERLEGSLAAAVVSIMNGARIVRVHDVKATVAAVRMTEAILGWREPAWLKHNM